MNPTPGHKTTEFWIHVAAQLASITAIVLPQVVQIPGLPPAFLMVCGVLGSVLSSLGYGRSRTQLKLAYAPSALDAPEGTRRTISRGIGRSSRRKALPSHGSNSCADSSLV